jgi:hypothetical protein
LLEAVQVHHEDVQLLPGWAWAWPIASQQVGELHPVGQPGQLVLISQAADLEFAAGDFKRMVSKAAPRRPISSWRRM